VVLRSKKLEIQKKNCENIMLLSQLISKLLKHYLLIDYLLFYAPLNKFSLIWRHHHCQWRAAKFRPMLGAQNLWAGWDLYRATPAVTEDFAALIWRTATLSCLLQHVTSQAPIRMLKTFSNLIHWGLSYSKLNMYDVLIFTSPWKKTQTNTVCYW
jgi:hypothetical protein